MLTLANGLSNMLIYVEFDPIFLHILTIHHTSVAGKWRNFNNLSDHQGIIRMSQYYCYCRIFKVKIW